MSLLSTPKQTHNEHSVKTEAEVNTLDHRSAAIGQAPVAISPGQTITNPAVNEPEPAAGNTTRRPPALANLCRRLVSKRLRALCSQRLDIREVPAPSHTSPVAANGSPTEIRIHDSQFYQRLLFGGSLGAAESYLRGEWSSNDLLATMRLLVRKVQELESLDRESGHLQRPLRWALRCLHRNNLAGSRRNIAAHYDLSNQFFSLMLDPPMTYSAGLFAAPTCSMEAS